MLSSSSLEEEERITASCEEYDSLQGCNLLRMRLPSHKPTLGCTVEESLGNDNLHVFVAKVVPEGPAAMAGMQAGDVIVGVTSVTGDAMEDVVGLGIDKV